MSDDFDLDVRVHDPLASLVRAGDPSGLPTVFGPPSESLIITPSDPSLAGLDAARAANVASASKLF